MIIAPSYPRYPGGGLRRVQRRRSGARATITGLTLTEGESNVDQAGYPTGAFSPAALSLLVLAVYNTNGNTPSLPQSIVDSRGLTWDPLPDPDFTIQVGLSRQTLYYATVGAIAPGSGNVQINLPAGDGTTGCEWGIVQYQGCILGPGAFRNVQSASSGGASLGQTLTLPAFEHANNWHVYALTHNAAEATAAGTGFTSRAQQFHTLPSVALKMADAPNDTTADPSWVTSSASRWIHFELVAAAA